MSALGDAYVHSTLSASTNGTAQSTDVGGHGPEAHRTQVKAVFSPQQQLCAGDHGLTACSDVGKLAQLRLDRPHV